jgi:hypothetical protein
MAKPCIFTALSFDDRGEIERNVIHKMNVEEQNGTLVEEVEKNGEETDVMI